MNNKERNHYPQWCFAPKFIQSTLTVLTLILGGCAISNEGVVTFRKTNLAEKGLKISENSASTVTPTTSKAGDVNDGDKKIDTKDQKMLPLHCKNFTLSEEGKFVEGDSISVHLRTAYIKDFAEMRNPLLAVTRIGYNAHGEIAIVANAFEMNTGKELDFINTKAGRLVFFSDDVLKEQYLNFNNMPIYGPIKYSGAPLAFRITIFELDVNSEQAKALLSTVAQAGSMAYPPASPILSLLNGLGQALINSDQDDTEFRYSMILDPSGGSENLINHFILEAGNYVIIRNERANKKQIPWDELLLDEDEGIVYWQEKPDEPYKPYRENTYLVVEINKNISSLDIDLSQNSFEELLEFLENKDKEKAADLHSIQKILSEAAVPRAQTVSFNKAKGLLAKIKNSNISVIERRSSTEKLIRMIGESLNEDGTIKEINPDNLKDSPKLSDSQVEYLLSSLRQSIPNFTLSRSSIAKAVPKSNTKPLHTKPESSTPASDVTIGKNGADETSTANAHDTDEARKKMDKIINQIVP